MSVKFSFVTSKYKKDDPIKLNAAKNALEEMGFDAGRGKNEGADEKVLVFGVPASSGVSEQPFGKVTEHGATIYGGETEKNVVGRIIDLEAIFSYLPAHINNDQKALYGLEEKFKKRVADTAEMLEHQIELYVEAGHLTKGTTLATLIEPENRHSVFSFENGMFSIEEAEQRRAALGDETAVGFSNLEDAKKLGPQCHFIDTCVCAVALAGQDPRVSYDAGLPVLPEMTPYVYQVMGYNEAKAEDGRAHEGLTSTKKMMENNHLQNLCIAEGWDKKFDHQDPHSPVSFVINKRMGRDGYKSRAEFLSEGVLPAFRDALNNEISANTATLKNNVLTFGGQDKTINLG